MDSVLRNNSGLIAGTMVAEIAGPISMSNVTVYAGSDSLAAELGASVVTVSAQAASIARSPWYPDRPRAQLSSGTVFLCPEGDVPISVSNVEPDGTQSETLTCRRCDPPTCERLHTPQPCACSLLKSPTRMLAALQTLWAWLR
jgi:hypothetical protein